MKLEYRLYHATHFHWWKIAYTKIIHKIFGHKFVFDEPNPKGFAFCLRCKTFFSMKYDKHLFKEKKK